MSKKLILFLLFFAFVPAAAAADETEWYIDLNKIQNEILYSSPEFTISFMDYDGRSILRFSGTIDQNAHSIFKIFYLSKTPDYIALAGPGGLFLEGMKMSGMIESYEIPVIILPLDICLSACAFAAMSSPKFEIEGLLGLHMPYRLEVPEDNLEFLIHQKQIRIVTYSMYNWFKKGLKLPDKVFEFLLVNTDHEKFITIDSTKKWNDLKLGLPPEEIFTTILGNENNLTEWLDAKRLSYDAKIGLNDK